MNDKEYFITRGDGRQEGPYDALLLQHYKYSGWLSAGINIIIAKFFPTEPGEHATIN